jgi:hypothetical protein
MPTPCQIGSSLPYAYINTECIHQNDIEHVLTHQEHNRPTVCKQTEVGNQNDVHASPQVH